jgi:hypothetical protein
VGLLAGGGVPLGVRVRGADQPGRHVLHGLVHAAPVHDAAGARRRAHRRPRRLAPRAHAARDAAHVRLPHGQCCSPTSTALLKPPLDLV